MATQTQDASTASTTRVELADIQGLVARSFAALRQCSYVLLGFGDGPGARRWLDGLVPRITDGEARTEDVARGGEAVNVAFTSAGLKAMGLGERVLRSFTIEFQEGMAPAVPPGGESNRQRVLGDCGDADPREWRWGGPKNDEVHAVLLLFAGGEDEARLDALFAREERAAAEHGVRVIRRLPSIMLEGDKEHFGFHDGIAQPRVAGFRPDEMAAPTSEKEIPAGEVVLGYPNAYEQLPDSPWVPRAADPAGLLPDAPADPDLEDPSPRADLGKNGSYLVFRQLEQDVRRFWQVMDERARRDAPRRKLLASKIVGRWPNGAPLVIYPKDEPAGYDPKTQDGDRFLYVTESDQWKGGGDPHGEKCPLGAHVRRSNPRDGMQPGPAESLLVADRHRLLRRGRAYGPPLAPSFDPADILAGGDDPAGGDRGLHFLCFNTDIVRQFEFVQGTWVNNMKFDGLYADPDALIAPHLDPGSDAARKNPERISTFTEQRCPVRHRETAIPRFVTMRGGAYFFMPGIRALRYLASL